MCTAANAKVANSSLLRSTLRAPQSFELERLVLRILILTQQQQEKWGNNFLYQKKMSRLWQTLYLITLIFDNA